MKKRVLIFSFAYYPYVGGAEVAIKEITDRLPSLDFDLITYNLGGEAAEEQIGNIHVYRVAGPSKYLYPFRAFAQGLALHRKNQYEIVWSMMANAGFAALFLKLLFPRLRYILSIQEGDPIPEMKRRVWFVYPFFKMVFSRADYVTALSNYLADYARSMGAWPVEVVPNGVDLHTFKVKNEIRLQDQNKITLITTSRLVKKNAVDDIIKSLQYLPENVLLHIVGSGPEEQELKSLEEELALDKRVEFTPYTEHAAMAEMLREADIFVRPSLSEGLGSSFLEAMASGLPIVATPVGGIPDFLKDGETGLFCEVSNPADVAAKVKRLIDDPELYVRIRQNGRRLIQENYNWDAIAKRFGQIFNPGS